jgi:hypothetical protein
MRPFRRGVCPALLLVLLGVGPCAAQDRAAAAQELALKILAATGQNPSLELSFENQSSLDVAAAAAIEREIGQGLRSGGASLGAANPAAFDVRITLSESWRNLLLVAQIRKGEAEQVVMVAFSQPEPGSGGGNSANMTLARQQVWRQSAPMLSFLVTEAAADKSPSLWVLEPERLVLYRQMQGQWRPQASAPIAPARRWPRDLRGLLWVESTGPVARLHVSLPGMECAMPLTFPPPSLPLARGPAGAMPTFPIFEGATVAATTAFAAGRNFFGPQVARGGGEQQLQPFFSASVVLDDRGLPKLLAAGLDGKATLYDPSGKPAGTIAGWGSDLVGLKTDCGSGWQVLATGPGDWTKDDFVAAYQIVEGKAVPAGAPLAFDGPVLALWPEPGGAAAGAVVRDRSTDAYEAYTITLACNH